MQLTLSLMKILECAKTVQISLGVSKTWTVERSGPLFDPPYISKTGE